MREISELKFEELSVKQKLGMVHAAVLKYNSTPEDVDYVCELIKERALGAIWIQWNHKNAGEYMKRVKAVADYPILIITDAESGIGDYLIGRHNAIGCTGDERYAYAFGKVTAFNAAEMGYNIVCNPIMDIKTNGWVRSLGSDKHKLAKLAAAEARGMHDAGILTVGKHYPSGDNPDEIDSHMAEAFSMQTEEELLDYSLYAYLELMKEGLLDGLMTAHHKFVNIDSEYPASLSKKVIDIIKKQGFDGFFISDALSMMGIRAKFGDVVSKGLSIEAGNDLALTYDSFNKFNQDAIDECYKNGIISDERLDEAVKRVLRTQHKALEMSKARCKSLTDEELELCKRINKDSVYARVDDGLSANIARDGKYLFAVMTSNEENVVRGEVAVDTFSNGWHRTTKIVARIKELFPNSDAYVFHQFPTQGQNFHILNNSIDYDDVIMLTFTEAVPYTGSEHLTRRVESLIAAMQYTNRISTLVHFGNPCVLGNLPHISRYILGGLSAESVDTCLEILAGEYEAKGVLSYDVKLN